MASEETVRELFVLVFEKVKSQIGSSVENRMMMHLENELDRSIVGSGNRNLNRYYKKYVLGDFEIQGSPKKELLDALSEYVDFDDYEDFSIRSENNTSTTSGGNVYNVTSKNTNIITNSKGDINMS